MVKMRFDNQRGSTYPRIDYKWWFALAEFVDNSTQSYFDHKREVDEALKESNDAFCVEITRDDDLVRITDNAFGMDMEALDRAMNVATPPPTPKGKKLGRSRYGVGMKTASGWAGRYMEIRTTMLGSGKEITIKIDWDKINVGEEELEETIREVPKNTHGTTIQLSGLYDQAQGNTVATMKRYLRSIYRIDIREKKMILKWDSDPLEGYSIAGDDFQLKPDNTTWTKEFDSKLSKSNKRVNGWFGVLKKGSAGRSKAGISIFHNDRMVEGWPDTWRPSLIYGGEDGLGSNSLINQRLVGEIHLDDFEIAHTKDGIRWRTGEESDVAKLIDEEVSDLIKQAKKTYKEIGKDPKGRKKIFKQAAATLKDELEENQGAFVDKIQMIETVPPISSDKQKEVNSVIVNQAANKKKAEWTIDLGHYEIRLYLENNGDDRPYYVNDVSEDSVTTVFVVVNLDHPHYENNDDELSLLNLRHVVIDAIAEYAASRLKRSDHTTVNTMKDGFLRLEWEVRQDE